MLGHMSNRLADSASLYLRQHADNPVDWYPWGDEAFARAREEDRPVLLSIGYSSCHWCHVMAHESFENEDIARQMNATFVCIKVDREERPDVDALYMQATLALSGQGGWPMTVFLTPEAEPFFAGTYFPPESLHGQPGFPDVLRFVDEAYRTRRGDVSQTGAQVRERLEQRVGSAPQRPLADVSIDDAVTGLAVVFDPHSGGFSGAPKFPPHLVLEFLLRRLAWRPGDLHARRMAETTLTHMADGGIHDQVGGGFHRYSTDNVWLVPHFEKMLYDNALLVRVYALAYAITGEGHWREVAESTVDYLEREMAAPDGGFASAQDADSPGGEGAYFTWTAEQLEQVLTYDEGVAVVVRYGMRPEGNFEGANILRVAAPMAKVAEAVGPEAQSLLASALPKMLAARAERPAPDRDDKVIASWNGLTVGALAMAGVWLDRPGYVARAAEVADFVLSRLRVDGRLRRTWMDGESHHLGCLDDYANLIDGLLDLHAATSESRWLRTADELAGNMLELFADAGGAGFFFAGSDGEALIARTREVEDHPTPSGNSQAAWVLWRLSLLTGKRAYEVQAQRALELVSQDAVRFPHAFGSALIAMDAITGAPPTQVVVAGPAGDPGVAALARTARTADPLALVLTVDPTDADAVAASPLFADRGPVDGRPAAYVCHGTTCQAPVTDVEALRATMAGAPS